MRAAMWWTALDHQPACANDTIDFGVIPSSIPNSCSTGYLLNPVIMCGRAQTIVPHLSREAHCILASKKTQGLRSRMHASSRPLASAGPLGTTTFTPGTCV